MPVSANMGKFIVIEGLDGAGKSTQTEILTEKLLSRGVKVINHAEPTESEFGKMCREVLSGRKKITKSQLALLFTADRIEHNVSATDGINMHLQSGDTVICDRYYYSTLAYQGVDVGIDWLKSLNLGCEDIRKPDLCIFLDLTPEKSMERIKANRNADEIEIYENLEYLKSIRKRFYNVINSLKDSENICVINADGTVDEVASRIEKAVNAIY